MSDPTTAIKQALIGQQNRLVKLTTPLVSVKFLLRLEHFPKIMTSSCKPQLAPFYAFFETHGREQLDGLNESHFLV